MLIIPILMREPTIGPNPSIPIKDGRKNYKTICKLLANKPLTIKEISKLTGFEISEVNAMVTIGRRRGHIERIIIKDIKYYTLKEGYIP